ncbi:MAG: 50S ribosomal protein L4 [Thiotrichales bacterium]
MELQSVSGSSVSVSDEVFGRDYNPSLIHQAVVSFLAGARSGTKAQKNRSAVRGGGAKPWRQKGTGRARAGTIRSPLWRSGGVTFAASPRDYAQKMNKKMVKAALKSIFSELVRQERLVVVESLELAEPKTKLLKEKLEGLGCADALLLVDQFDDNLLLASRNLPGVNVSDVSGVNAYSLLRNEKVVATEAAVKAVGEWLV